MPALWRWENSPREQEEQECPQGSASVSPAGTGMAQGSGGTATTTGSCTAAPAEARPSTHTVAGIPAPKMRSGFNIPVRVPAVALISQEVTCG